VVRVEEIEGKRKQGKNQHPDFVFRLSLLIDLHLFHFLLLIAAQLNLSISAK
jgi:hypothetical protein